VPEDKVISGPALTSLLFDEAGVGLCLVAPDGTVVRANREWLRATALTADQAIGQDIVELFPETREIAVAMHARARAGHRVAVPRHAQHVAGRETLWEGSVAPVPMENGTGLLITARDVTEQVAREQRPANFAALCEALFEQSGDGVLLARTDGTILRANPAACRAYGQSESELRGRSRAERLGDDVALRAFVEELESAGLATAQLTARRGDGTTFPVEVTASVISAGATEPYLCVTFRDVTVRRRAEEAERVATELREELRGAKRMSGLVPMCAWCHKVRDESGDWQRIDAYVSERTRVRFTHGMCPECLEQYG
jgi:PAS domain S-box-containing protein